MKGLKPKLAILLSNIWPIFGILLISLVFFYPVWFKNKIPLPVDALVGAHVPWTEIQWEEYPAGVPIKNQEITDAISQFYPWRSLVGEFWRKGKTPLWNPYMFSGTPFLATLHSAVLYPLNIYYLFLNDINAWSLLVFSQIVLSGIFMYLFLIQLGLKKYAGLLGAITFSLSGYMIAWLEFATGGHAGLWLPLLLLLEMKLVKSSKFIWILLISIVFFFIYTAGDFQAPFYITTTYILFGVYLEAKEHELYFKNLFKVISGLLFGILLALPQILPTVELFSQSVRMGDPYINEYFYGLMHWEKIVNFLWPDFFGNVVTRNYWGKFGYHEYLAFVGVVPLVFVVFSLLKKRLKYERFFWLLLFLSLLFLLPTPVAFIPYKLKIPGLGTSSASRIIYLVDLSLAVLAAYGFSKWEIKDIAKLKKVLFYFLIVSIGVGLGLGYSIYRLNLGSNGDLVITKNLKVTLKNIIPSTLVSVFVFVLLSIYNFVYKSGSQWTKRVIISYPSIFPLAILLITASELLRFAWKNTSYSPREFVFPKTEIIEFLQEKPGTFRIAGGIPLNLFMPFKLKSAEGYDPFYPKINSEWFSLVNSGSLSSLSGRYGIIHRFDSPLLDYSGVKYVVDYKKNQLGGISENGNFAPGILDSRFQEVFSEGRIKVFENKNALPRIWLSTNYSVIKDRNEAVDILLKSESSERLVILEKGPRLTFQKDSDLNYKLSSYKFDLNETSFSVESSRDALVFLSESFYPGWRAYVDNQEIEIFRANFLFQSIPISKGVHKVKFIYNPKSFKIGLWLSTATFVILIGLIVYEKRYTRSRSRASSASSS